MYYEIEKYNSVFSRSQIPLGAGWRSRYMLDTLLAAEPGAQLPLEKSRHGTSYY
jgi:hypothetical protein